MKRFLEFISESDFNINSLDYDQNYGKSFRFAYTPKDQSGTFSIVTPSNADAWKSWKPVSSQDGEMLKKKFLEHQKAGTLNQFLRPHKVKQIAKHAIISENWSVATTKEQLFSPVGKYIFHVTTPQRAEKIMKTGLKPTRKVMGKFNVRLDADGFGKNRAARNFGAYVTGSEGLPYWISAVGRALGGKRGYTDERDIEILKYPMKDVPKNDRRTMFKVDEPGTRDASQSSSLEKRAYMINKTLGGINKRKKRKK